MAASRGCRSYQAGVSDIGSPVGIVGSPTTSFTCSGSVGVRHKRYSEGNPMLRRELDRRQFLTTTAATLAAGGLAGSKAFAADPVKIGLILPMTGQQQSTGRQTSAAVKLYMAQNG